MRCYLVQILRYYDLCEAADKYRQGHSATPLDTPRLHSRTFRVQPFHQYPMVNEKENAHCGTFFLYSSVQSLYAIARES